MLSADCVLSVHVYQSAFCPSDEVFGKDSKVMPDGENATGEIRSFEIGLIQSEYPVPIVRCNVVYELMAAII